MDKTSSGILVSAPRKSSGKTTLTLGLAGALMKEGVSTRVFKKGPDYIDPMWHKAVTGYDCYTIDPFWMEPDLCREVFLKHALDVDFNIIEGNHGLHDGLDLMGSNSSAYLSKLLAIPVLLVIDSTGMNRGAAAVVLGQKLLDPEINIAGVVLNNVAGQRQVNKQIAAIEHYSGIPVLGALPRTTNVQIKERHLGLITIHESELVKEVTTATAKAVAENCDLKKIQELAGNICRPQPIVDDFVADTKSTVKIGVAFDKSFCFYYPDNFESLSRAGADLVFFDTLQDPHLPEVDALYIGGGFPESFLTELEENRSMRKDIYRVIEAGMPVYAECGGLMYLTRSIERENLKKEMVGVLPADVKFQKKPVGKGYIELKTIPGKGWLQVPGTIKGHEFHYSRLENIGAEIEYSFDIKRGMGIDGKSDGILYKNVLAAYTHLNSTTVPEWASQFVEFVKLKRIK